MSRGNTPSEEDFARAKSAMKNRDRGLSDVRERVLRRFRGRGVHEFFILYSPATETFAAYVFYPLGREIGEADASGLSGETKDSVYEELIAVGRGKRDTPNVVFEFDSHENIEQNYEGDYYNRLR